MGNHEPMLMLVGDADGYGTRWTLDGQQVEPAIASYLMKEGFIAEKGSTELGARKLGLTASGTQFCHEGIAWWSSLGILRKLKIVLLG
ncbi:MAG: hypothetical protein D4S02_15580 [Rhodocyclaceae bacterium]|nr:MAG: hypothetical protein D4S02_15580 [Rhodocyclaceae bacterium]